MSTTPPEPSAAGDPLLEAAQAAFEAELEAKFEDGRYLYSIVADAVRAALEVLASPTGLINPESAEAICHSDWPSEPFTMEEAEEGLSYIDEGNEANELVECFFPDADTEVSWEHSEGMMSSGSLSLSTLVRGGIVYSFDSSWEWNGENYLLYQAYRVGDEEGRRAFLEGEVQEFASWGWGQDADVYLATPPTAEEIHDLDRVAESLDHAPWDTGALGRAIDGAARDKLPELAVQAAEDLDAEVDAVLERLTSIFEAPRRRPADDLGKSLAWWLTRQ